MKERTKCILIFLAGFILGPIVVVESWGHWVQWRIHQQDLKNEAEMKQIQHKPPN